MIAIDGAHLPRPANAVRQRLPLARPFQHLALGINQFGDDAGQGLSGRAGLEVGGAGQWAMIERPPVSVCHQVSTMGQRLSPTTR